MKHALALALAVSLITPSASAREIRTPATVTITSNETANSAATAVIPSRSISVSGLPHLPVEVQTRSTTRQRGIGGFGKPSTKATLIVMAAVAAFFVVVWATVPRS